MLTIVPTMYWKYENERRTLSLKRFTNKWTDNENIVNKRYYRQKEAGVEKSQVWEEVRKDFLSDLFEVRLAHSLFLICKMGIIIIYNLVFF